MTFMSQSASRNSSDEPVPNRFDRVREVDSFGPAEWAVIETARAESARWAKSAGVLMRLMNKLIGIPQAEPLANKRLEVLRCFAVAAWFRDEIPTRHMRALFSVGFSSNDAVRIITHVAAVRGMTPQVEAWP